MTVDRYQEVTTAFGGTGQRLGPIIHDCLLVMGRKYRKADENGRRMFSRDLISELKLKCSEWQVNGAADELIRTYGHIPLEGAPDEHTSRADVQQVRERLQGLAIGSHIVNDQAGLGTTKQTLLALAFAVRFSPEATPQVSVFTDRPSRTCPSRLLSNAHERSSSFGKGCST